MEVLEHALLCDKCQLACAGSFNVLLIQRNKLRKSIRLIGYHVEKTGKDENGSDPVVLQYCSTI